METPPPQNRFGGADDPSPALQSTILLLERARSGDATAVERLFARYLPRMRAWASGRLPAAARGVLETDDVVQDVLLRTIRRVEGFEARDGGGGGGFHGYLRQALSNRIRDAVRTAAARPGTGELPESLAARGPSPLDAAIGREDAARYEAALEQLRPEERELVIARVEMDMSYDEIAEAMGKPSRNAARMATARAIERLARAMTGAGATGVGDPEGERS